MSTTSDLLRLANELEGVESKAAAAMSGPISSDLWDLDTELEDVTMHAHKIERALDEERDEAEREYNALIGSLRGKSHKEIVDASGELGWKSIKFAKLKGAAKRMHEQAEMLENISENVKDIYQSLSEA